MSKNKKNRLELWIMILISSFVSMSYVHAAEHENDQVDESAEVDPLFVRTMDCSSIDVRSVVFSPDGRYILAAGVSHNENNNNSGVFKVWDWDYETSGKMFSIAPEEIWATVATFSPDGKIIAFRLSNSSILLWSVRQNEPIRVLPDRGDFLGTFAFNAEGSHIYSGRINGGIRVWNVETGICERMLRGDDDDNANESIKWLVLSRDGKQILSGGPFAVRFWNSDSGQNFKSLSIPGYHVRFSPDGKTFVSGDSSGNMTVRDCETYEIKRVLRHGRFLYDIVFSSDGRYLLSSGSRDNSLGDYFVKLWDLRKGVCLEEFEGNYATFSPDDRYIVYYKNHELILKINPVYVQRSSLKMEFVD